MKNNLLTHAAILLIDPFVSGNYIMQRFHEEGFKIIVLTTTEDFRKEKISFVYADFHLSGKGEHLLDVEKINQLLTKNNLYLWDVIPGYEGTLHEAEKIRYIFFPSDANDPENTIWRTNKSVTNSRLHRCNVPASKQWKIKSVNDIEDIDDNCFPIVLKPSDASTASIGVKICHDRNTAKQAFYTMPKVNLVIKKPIKQIVAENYLQGNEYVVDTVTRNAKHDIINIYHKCKYQNTGSIIFKYGLSLDSKSELFDIISNYIQGVLDALKIIHGINHLELILTAKGPVLIEINPRISGSEGYLSKLSQYSHGQDQISYLVEKKKPHQYTPAALFYIQNLNNHKYKAVNTDFRCLPSYKEHKIYKNEYIKPMENRTLFDTVGVVLLSHSKLQNLKQDLAFLEEADFDGRLYA